MNTASANATWARRIVRACVEVGVTHAFISPGSRNTPLLLALERAGVASTVVIDERSAGFVALGYIRSAGSAAAVVCTSGSAPFHYGPAIAEADASSLPLVILSADRPARLRGCGSMQTSLQANLFPEVLRASADLPAPVHGEESIMAAEEALSALHGGYPGPVMLNLQFEEPLWDESCETLPRGAIAKALVSNRDFGFIEDDRLPSDFFGAEYRGVITVGPPAFAGLTYPPEFEAAIHALADACGWPILAELHSGLRTESPSVVKYPDLSSRVLSQEIPDEAERVLHFGLFPTSKNIQGLLHAAHQVVHVDTRPGKRLPLKDNLTTFRASPASLLTHLPPLKGTSANRWAQKWKDADKRIEQVLDGMGTESLFEPHVAQSLLSFVEPNGILVVANSMPIRQLDVWTGCQMNGRRTMVARGVSGIDGTISSAIGAAIAHEKPVWVFLGDLAFLHDAGALALVRQLGVPIRILVSDNRGGGIFRRLPISKHPSAFESHFITPQDRLNLSDVAAGFGIGSHQVSSPAELTSALESMAKSSGASVTVVKTDSEFDVVEEQRILSLLSGVAA